jgi:hypothetical protein
MLPMISYSLIFKLSKPTNMAKLLSHSTVLFLYRSLWPAPGSEDTEFGVLMEQEVRHGEAAVYARVQA